MIGGHAPRACPPIIYQPGLTIQATLTNADYAGNVSLTEIVPDFGRHLRKCPMLSALAGRWCGSAAPRTLRDGVGQCAQRIGPHHPSEPGAAEPHHRRALANAEDALEYSTIPGCGGAAPPPSFGECGGCFGIFHDPRVRRSRTTARREH